MVCDCHLASFLLQHRPVGEPISGDVYLGSFESLRIWLKVIEFLSQLI